tara:strand:+ start:745 stop:1599 length:855 start_codon:yes stop_codon:yes gene_type:complete
MLRGIFTAILITFLLPSYGRSEEVIIKPGDTLSEIAERYKIPLKALMQINGIDNPSLIRIGQKIKTSKANQTLREPGGNIIHIVKSGESLGRIALTYGVSEGDIVSINRIDNINYLYKGQKLRIPNNKKTQRKSPIKESQNNHYIVKEGDNLSYIAYKQNISLNDLINLNNLASPDDISIGDKLIIRTKNITVKKTPLLEGALNFKQSEWRNYGPLQVDWANWKSMNGSFYTPSLNKEGKSLYLAINCSSRRINATGANGSWKRWISAKESFEHDLINDLCKTN